MSVGYSTRKIVGELSAGLRMCKFMGGFKPSSLTPVLGARKCKDISQLSVGKGEIEKLHFSFPKLDVDIKKNIIEPEKIKLNFELPIRSTEITELELPFQIEKEIKEPGKVISKKAIYMIRVRRRKMRKHKRKKYLKRCKAELFKRRMAREKEKEENFQAQVRSILEEKENFSAEKYVEDMLSKANWVPPVNRVKGRLAPQWVIKQYLENREEKRILNERIEACLKQK